MNSRHDNARLRASRRRGFTILELLVAVSVMTLVIYVLYALFNQTQMALRKNASQVDVNEGGRAAMEMIVRELSQMEVSGYPASTDLQTKLTYSGSKSFFSRVTPGESVALRMAYQSDAMPPEEDAWAIDQGFRTNILQDFTFTSRGDSGFHVTSYRVIDVDSGVGMLARYRTNGTLRVTAPGQALLNKTEIFNRFYFEPVANTSAEAFEPITDGVIHLRITPYDQLGRQLSHDTIFYDPLGLNFDRRGAAGQALFQMNTNRPVDGTLMQDPYAQRDRYDQSQAQFYGALPSYFDVEMAVIAPRVLKQVRSLPPEPKRVRADFLGRQIGKVTLFRQRVPIRDTK